MTDKIKPCPFCGGKSKVEQCEPSTARFNEGAVHFKVSCPPMVGGYISDCIGSNLNLWEITPEDAISKWNNRAIPSGYTLVPDEPTEAMLETGVDALMSTEIVADRLVILIYKAMLKAVKESL